jgi:hypothetical protein
MMRGKLLRGIKFIHKGRTVRWEEGSILRMLEAKEDKINVNQYFGGPGTWVSMDDLEPLE